MEPMQAPLPIASVDTAVIEASTLFAEVRVSKKLYVGNLSFSATEDQLKDYFGQFGEVISVKIITDRATGRSRGFCFVEMENADAAMNELNGKEYDGRKLMINEAREREPRSNHGGGDHGDHGGGGGGGGYNRGHRREY